MSATEECGVPDRLRSSRLARAGGTIAWENAMTSERRFSTRLMAAGCWPWRRRPAVVRRQTENRSGHRTNDRA